MANVMVTGSAGFIGSHLVTRLLEARHNVVGFDRRESRAIAGALPRSTSFTGIVGDLGSREQVHAAMRDIDVVFHLGAMTSAPESVLRPSETYSTNVIGTLNVLDAAAASGVKRVVFASSAAVYGDVESSHISEDSALVPVSPYGTSKLIGEQLCESFVRTRSLETIALRLFNVYGPFQQHGGTANAVVPTFVGRLKSGERPIIYGDGAQTRSFTYVDDVVAAFMSAADLNLTDFAVVNVAAENCMTVSELLSQITFVLDRSIEPEYRPARPGDIVASCPDLTRMNAMLAPSSRTPIEVGIKRTIESFA